MAILFLLLTLGGLAWALCARSQAHWSDAPEFRHWLRQASRDRRRQEWDRIRQVWRRDLWHAGDAGVVLALLALTAVVIAVCR